MGLQPDLKNNKHRVPRLELVSVVSTISHVMIDRWLRLNTVSCCRGEALWCFSLLPEAKYLSSHMRQGDGLGGNCPPRGRVLLVWLLLCVSVSPVAAGLIMPCHLLLLLCSPLSAASPPSLSILHWISLCSHNSLDLSPSYNLFSLSSHSHHGPTVCTTSLCVQDPNSSTMLWLHPITGPKMAFSCQCSRPALKQIVCYNSRRSWWSLRSDSSNATQPHNSSWKAKCGSAQCFGTYFERTAL